VPPASAVSLESLRSLIKSVEKPARRERFPFSSVAPGIPRGAIIEIAGAGKTEVIIQFLAENPTLRVAWVEDHMTVYPCAIVQRRVALHRLLFIEARREVIWALLQVLRSGLFECVVVSSKEKFNENSLRRLQLEAEKAHVGFFLLSEKQSNAWPIAMKLKVDRQRLNLGSSPQIHFDGLRSGA